MKASDKSAISEFKKPNVDNNGIYLLKFSSIHSKTTHSLKYLRPKNTSSFKFLTLIGQKIISFPLINYLLSILLYIILTGQPFERVHGILRSYLKSAKR